MVRRASRAIRSRMPGGFARARTAPALQSRLQAQLAEAGVVSAVSLSRSGRYCGLAAALAVQKPATAVAPHVLDQGHESATLLGQAVLDPGRHLGIGPSLDDPMLLQSTQAKREGARADPLQRALQFAEPLASVRQITDHEERPLAGDDLRATTNWTGILSHRFDNSDAGLSPASTRTKPQYSSMLYELK